MEPARVSATQPSKVGHAVGNPPSCHSPMRSRSTFFIIMKWCHMANNPAFRGARRQWMAYAMAAAVGALLMLVLSSGPLACQNQVRSSIVAPCSVLQQLLNHPMCLLCLFEHS